MKDTQSAVSRALSAHAVPNKMSAEQYLGLHCTDILHTSWQGLRVQQKRMRPAVQSMPQLRDWTLGRLPSHALPGPHPQHTPQPMNTGTHSPDSAAASSPAIRWYSCCMLPYTPDSAASALLMLRLPPTPCSCNTSQDCRASRKWEQTCSKEALGWICVIWHIIMKGCAATHAMPHFRLLPFSKHGHMHPDRGGGVMGLSREPGQVGKPCCPLHVHT